MIGVKIFFLDTYFSVLEAIGASSAAHYSGGCICAIRYTYLQGADQHAKNVAKQLWAKSKTFLAKNKIAKKATQGRQQKKAALEAFLMCVCIIEFTIPQPIPKGKGLAAWLIPWLQ